VKRAHLFEWEDQPWLPRTIRDFLTDQLRFAQSSRPAAGLQRSIGSLLRQALQRLDTVEIVDLCSGGGGPMIRIRERLAAEGGLNVRLTLTDRFPNVDAFRQIERRSGGAVRCRYDSINVFDVPADLEGLRTLCTALHHFRFDDARRILQDAVDKRAGIAVFEPLERSLKLFMVVTAGAFVGTFLTTPFVGKMSFSRFALTYLLPVCPFVTAWDGAVSVLRSYNVEALEEMTCGLGNGGYEWRIACVKVPSPIGPMPLTYLIGLPTAGTVASG
jgi:hypothetical protein